MYLDLSNVIAQLVQSENSIPNNFHDLVKEVNASFRKTEDSLQDNEYIDIDLGILGSMKFPFYRYKTLTSLNLLSVEDLFLFTRYYHLNSSNNIFIDIGSNIGLHTLIANNIGYKVLSFEPDPSTFKLNTEFLTKNSIKYSILNEFQCTNIEEFFLDNNVAVVNAAVSNFNGVSKFNQFIDNPTGNHLDGRKHNIYGDISEITVKVFDLSKIKLNAIIKIDAEGEDAQILDSILKANKISGKFYLCDWRNETRLNIFNLISAYNVGAFNPFTNKQIFSESDLPINKSADFIVLNVSAN